MPQTSIIPHECLAPAAPVGCEKSSACAWITIVRFKIFAMFPVCKLMAESVKAIVVTPVEVVETMLPRSPTCLVVEVGIP